MMYSTLQNTDCVPGWGKVSADQTRHSHSCTLNRSYEGVLILTEHMNMRFHKFGAIVWPISQIWGDGHVLRKGHMLGDTY